MFNLTESTQSVSRKHLMQKYFEQYINTCMVKNGGFFQDFPSWRYFCDCKYQEANLPSDLNSVKVLSITAKNILFTDKILKHSFYWCAIYITVSKFIQWGFWDFKIRRKLFVSQRRLQQAQDEDESGDWKSYRLSTHTNGLFCWKRGIEE